MTSTQFEQALLQEKAAWQQLVTLLEREEAALGQAGLGDLPEITAQKDVQVQLLTQLDEQRASYCKTVKAPLAAPNLLAWLRKRPGAGAQQAADAWQESVALAQRAMELNQVNGGLLNVRYLNNQQALSVMFAIANRNATYDRSGTLAVGEARRLVSLG